MRRVLFRLGGVPVYSYPAMLYCGIVLGIDVQLYAARSIGLAPMPVLALTLALLTVALLGARLLFVLPRWRHYAAEPSRVWRYADSPHGAVTWQYDGRVAGEQLTAALDANLARSAGTLPVAVRSGPDLGVRVTIGDFLGQLEPAESRCPPWPLGRTRIEGATIAFVQRPRATSASEWRRLFPERPREAGGAPPLMLVVDGADAQEVDALTLEIGIEEIVGIPDPQGTIADRFRIGDWPTTMTLDDEGVVTDVAVGPRAANAGGEGHAEHEGREPGSE